MRRYSNLKVLLRKFASTEVMVMGELIQSKLWFYSEVSWKLSVLIPSVVYLAYCLRKFLVTKLHIDVKEHKHLKITSEANLANR